MMSKIKFFFFGLGALLLTVFYPTYVFGQGGPEITGSCLYRDNISPILSYCTPMNGDPAVTVTEQYCNNLCVGREEFTVCTFYEEKETCPTNDLEQAISGGTGSTGSSGSGSGSPGSGSTATPPQKEAPKLYKPIELKNPLGLREGSDIPRVIGRVIDRLLGVVGALALGVFVYGGVVWLTSAGNDDRVKKGTQAMVYAVVGLFIIFSSYGILRLIINQLTS